MIKCNGVAMTANQAAKVLVARYGVDTMVDFFDVDECSLFGFRNADMPTDSEQSAIWKAYTKQCYRVLKFLNI